MIISRKNVLFISFILSLSVLLLNSCEKSSGDQDKSSLRIKSVYHYWLGQQSISKIVDSNVYVDNQLSVTYTYFDYGTYHSDPSSKITYNYVGNQVISRLYYLSSQGPILSNMITYVIDNEKITSMLYEPVSNVDYESKQKLIYEYDGNYLVRETHSICYPNDIWENRNKSEYYYVNQVLDSIIEYATTGTDIWMKTGKLQFEYSGAKISRLFHYNYESNSYIQDTETLYSYSGNNILSIGPYNYQVTYQYDGLGNMISSNDGNYQLPNITIQYEKGTGNYAFIKYLIDPLSKFKQDPATICIP